MTGESIFRTDVVTENGIARLFTDASLARHTSSCSPGSASQSKRQPRQANCDGASPRVASASS